MFSRTWPTLFFAIVFVSIAAPRAHGSVATGIKQDVQSICNQADAAAGRKDINGAVAFYGDPALQGAARQGLQQLLALSVSALFSTKVISVDVPSGNDFEAIVVVRQHFQGLIKHQGQVGVAVSDAKVRQYWTKRANQWVVLRARVLSINRTLNSKRVSSF